MGATGLAISSDQETAATVLKEISTICHSLGAEWHPDLRAEILCGNMRLVAPPGTTGPLITLPTSLFIPIGGASWADNPKVLDLIEAPAGATTVQRDLLQLMVALYNSTGKLLWWCTQHPAGLAERWPEMATALAPLKPNHAGQWKGRSAAEGFLATRSFGWQADKTMQRQKVLMPLIDLLNHHHLGASYTIRDGMMQIIDAQVGGSECFAHYGRRRDVLDLALHYGHVDLSTPYAHSAAIEIELEGLGQLQVGQQDNHRPRHHLDPPRVTMDDQGLRLSHLCCDLEHPERVRTMLKLALEGALRRRGHEPSIAALLGGQGLRAIATENQRLLQRLAEVLEAQTHPGAATLSAACRRQADITTIAMNE